MPALYLMRHGQAEPASGGPDADRPLTLEGMRNVIDSAAGLLEMGVSFDSVLCSPLERAVQTARALAGAMNLAATPHLLDTLRPGAVAQAVLAAVQRRLGANTLLVGHMPDMSYLAGFLATGQVAGAVAFAPGAMACIDFAATPRPGAGAIGWVMSAEQLIRQSFPT